MSTSLITRIKKDSLITFKSGLEDIELFNRSDKKFRFSHFVLLNVPEIKTASNNENVSDFERIQSRFIVGNSVVTPPSLGDSIDLSESLQNYVLNFEEILTSKPEYNNNNLKTTSERIFFKWLKEIGAVRYRSATNSESNNLTPNYVEEDDNSNVGSGNLYSRLIQYVGEIEMQNKNTSNKNNFEEIYMLVPSQAGYTPVVLFNTLSDNNYNENMIMQRNSMPDREYIEGYNSLSPPPANGLDLLAQYDIDVVGLVYSSVNDVDNNDTDLWFDYYTGADAYLTDKTFSDPSNDEITVTHPTSALQKTYIRNRLDGVGIDFDKTSYVAFNDQSLKSFNQFNSSNTSFGFDFNCVALYYEVEENGVVERNLYGVLFLDDVVEVTGGQSIIRTQPKIKNSSVLNQSGNGYGYKLNFRIDTTNANVAVDVFHDINDYNVFSMQLFSEAVSRMAEITDNYENIISENVNLRNKNEELLNMIIASRESNIETILNQINSKLLTSTEFDTISELVNKNSKLIVDILTNKTKISSEIILSIIGKDGVDAKLLGSTLSIALSNSFYNGVSNKMADVKYNNKNNFKLGKRNKIGYLSSDPIIAQDDINVYIEDDMKWDINQSFKIVLSRNIDINGKSVRIFTDINSQFTNTSLGLEIGSIKPTSNVVEVVCINKTNYEFIIIG